MPLLLGFLPLPRGLVCGLLEPAAAFAIGAYLYNRSDDTQLLGTWLMQSGATLFVLEARMRGRRRQRIQGFGDAVIESEDLARRAQNFGRPQPGPFAGWRRGREAREQEQRRRQEEGKHAADSNSRSRNGRNGRKGRGKSRTRGKLGAARPPAA
jgi:hypothetical protein